MLHVPECDDLCGVINNASCSRFETRHSGPKNVAAHSNNRGIERQMIIHSQVQDVIHYIVHDGVFATGRDTLSMPLETARMLTTLDPTVSSLLAAPRPFTYSSS